MYDPKERLICAARFSERVLHHALMNICHPIFERYQIYDSYASRISKGTYAGIERAVSFQKQYNWFLKLDVRKFFDSIDHRILTGLLEQKFKEPKLLRIFWDIVESYKTELGKGLPIGNLTSQYFANHYLAVSDHFIKEKLRVKAYVRYMDDMVLWENDKAVLLEKGRLLQAFISDQLKLELKIFCLNKTKAGLPFLSYVLFKNKIHINENSRKRFRKKLNLYEHKLITKQWDESEYQNIFFLCWLLSKKQIV